MLGAICDEVSWLIMFAGFFAMALVPGPLGKCLAILGAAIIILFGGREKKGIVNRLLGGLLTLYNISGYLSDLLSYSRIFALGLATGVIAMVINTVAQMLWGAGPIGIVAAILVLLPVTISTSSSTCWVPSCTAAGCSISSFSASFMRPAAGRSCPWPCGPNIQISRNKTLRRM